jgi:HlyD family secretion protein
MRRVPRRAIAPLAAVIAFLAASACHDADAPDAYGNFEATEVVVSAETGGQLLRFAPEEGRHLAAGDVVGVVDTTQLALEGAQILAQRAAARSRVTEVGRQIDALTVQREIAQRAYERTKRLFDQHAATSQQLDQAEREFRVLGEQIQAARSQQRAAGQESTAAQARVAQIAERMRKSHITTPVGGTVLATYARTGEFVQPGQPLFKIANLDSLDLRAYVTGPQLATVHLGQRAGVSVDVGTDERRVLPGQVTWIASSAEFTPTPIQTRDERAELVYAVKVRVANPNGIAKIGMPADVRFLSASSRPAPDVRGDTARPADARQPDAHTSGTQGDTP